MSMEIFLSILNNISDFPAERKYIAISGGEPTLHPLFPAFVKEACNTGCETNIVTNGTTITKQMVDELFIPLKDNLVFAISIDGDEEIHNKIRNRKSAYSETTNAIRLLTDNGFNVAVNFTLNDFNCHTLDHVFELCVRLNVTSLKVRIPLECGNVDYTLNPFNKTEQYLYTLSRAVELSEESQEKYGLRVESNDSLWWIYSSTEKEKILTAQTDNDFGGCTAGWLQVFINSVGDVFPCAYLKEKMGNINELSLVGIIYNWQEKLTRLIERDTLEKCNSCSIKKYCGGCRARAYAKTGNIFAEDPLCPLN